MVLPALNEPQLMEEVPEDLGAGIRFHLVRTLEEALDCALDRPMPLRPAVARA